MDRPSTALVTLVVVLVAAGAPSLAAPAEFGAGGPSAAAEDDGSAEPGARIAGVVGAEGVELRASVERRALDVRLRKANTSTTRATVIAAAVDGLDDRVETLRERKQRLQAARENGTLSEAAYRAKIARLVARIDAVEKLANASAVAARDVAASDRDAEGIDVEHLRDVERSADALTDANVTSIARTVTDGGRGDPPADPPRGGPNASAGPSGADADPSTGRGDGPDARNHTGPPATDSTEPAGANGRPGDGASTRTRSDPGDGGPSRVPSGASNATNVASGAVDAGNASDAGRTPSDTPSATGPERDGRGDDRSERIARPADGTEHGDRARNASVGTSVSAP